MSSPSEYSSKNTVGALLDLIFAPKTAGGTPLRSDLDRPSLVYAHFPVTAAAKSTPECVNFCRDAPNEAFTDDLMI